jgi:hypothetical protein
MSLARAWLNDPDIELHVWNSLINLHLFTTRGGEPPPMMTLGGRMELAPTATGDTADATAESAASGVEVGDELGGLTRRDREILAFERQWWKYAGAKEQAIRELFDMSATRYYQVLNGLIDSSAAMAADPMLVKRLRRLRASRQRQRSARRLGIEV